VTTPDEPGELETAVNSALITMVFCMQPETWPVFLKFASELEGSDWSNMPVSHLKQDATVIARLIVSIQRVQVTPERTKKAAQALREAGLI
jgi:hypothetical protein